MTFRSLAYAAALTAAFICTPSASAGWSGWQPAGASTIVDQPSVVITANKYIYIMARGLDNALWWTVSKNGGTDWRGWESAGGVLINGPSCLEPLPNVVECYVVGQNGELFQINRIDSKWGAYFPLGGALNSNISAYSGGPDSRSVIGIGTDGMLYERRWWQFWDGGWLPWFSHQKNVGTLARPACAALSGNSTTDDDGRTFTRYDSACLIRRQNGTFLMTSQQTNEAGKFDIVKNEDIQVSPDTIYPASLIAGSNPNGLMLDVFIVAKATKQMMQARYIVGQGWQNDFTQIGDGQFESGPSCDKGASFKSVNMICTGRGMDGAVWFSVRTP